jgi:hypothetical protein
MANVKLAYGTATSSTGGLTSLASSSTWLAGYEWFVIDNGTSELAEDYFVDLVIRVGTTPTVNTEIRVYLAASYDGTTYPDVLDGTPSAETITSAGVRDSFMKLAGVGIVDATTSNRDYPIQFNVASFYPSLPKKIIVFVAHNTAVNLNATAGNHKYAYSPIYRTVT